MIIDIEISTWCEKVTHIYNRYYFVAKEWMLVWFWFQYKFQSLAKHSVSSLEFEAIVVKEVSIPWAQYERIVGTDDAAQLMRLNFRKWWCTTPMAAANGMDIQWKYEVPRWLFPPPISWTRGMKEMACGIVNVGDVYERMARDICESVR